jgi:hypothetical protein
MPHKQTEPLRWRLEQSPSLFIDHCLPTLPSLTRPRGEDRGLSAKRQRATAGSRLIVARRYAIARAASAGVSVRGSAARSASSLHPSGTRTRASSARKGRASTTRTIVASTAGIPRYLADIPQTARSPSARLLLFGFGGNPVEPNPKERVGGEEPPFLRRRKWWRRSSWAQLIKPNKVAMWRGAFLSMNFQSDV